MPDDLNEDERSYKIVDLS